MILRTKRPPDFSRMPQIAERAVKQFLSIRVGVALQEFQRSIERTPVYTGRTMANYRWSLGTPITDMRGPIKTPDLPGKTSVMSIGEEPRRAANASLVQSEFYSVLQGFAANPFQKIFLRNNVPNFDQIEYGAYGADSRTPAGGMTRRGEAQLRSIVRGVRKVG